MNSFLRRFLKVMDKLTDPKKLQTLFEQKKQSFYKNNFEKQVQYTVLKNQYKPMKELKPWDKDYKKYNRSGLIDFGDRSTLPRKFIQHLHPTNSIMLETLDDQISSFTIFKIQERPVDISAFRVQV